MSDTHYIDVIRLVGRNGDPPLTIRPWPDAPEVVELCAADEDAQDHYGRASIPMSAQMARLVAAALIACADEIEGAAK